MKDKKIFSKLNVFALIVTVSFIVSAAVICVKGISAMKYYVITPQKDVFSDFFDPIEKNAASNWKIDSYPPFICGVYRIISFVLPDGMIKSEDIKDSIYGIVLYSLHLLLFAVPLSILIAKYFKNTGLTACFTALLVISGPFIAAADRGNCVVYALLFTLIFFIYRDSDDHTVSELSLLSLAVAANIKIYPAIFILLIMKKKNTYKIIRFIIYSLVLFMCPLFFMKGHLSNIIFWAKNLVSFSLMNNGSLFGDGSNLSLVNVTELIYTLLKKAGIITLTSDPAIAGTIVKLAVMTIGLCIFPGMKYEWQKAMICSMLCIQIPGVSYIYVLIFLLIPFMSYLISDDHERTPSVLFGILFSFIVIPLRYMFYVYDVVRVPVLVTFGHSVVMICLFVFMIYLFVKAVKYGCFSKKEKISD